MFKPMILAGLLLPVIANAIIGGTPVEDIGEVPFIVRTSNDCGGVILSDSWILTAAHCGHSFSRNAIKVVFAGRTEIDLTQGYSLNDSTYSIDASIIHPKYHSASFLDENEEKTTILYNDVMLIRTSTKIHFSEKIRPVKIADPIDLGQEQLTVYGWGDTIEGAQTRQKHLMKATLPNVSIEKANSEYSYRGLIKDWAHVVMGYEAGGVDACQGDSGGPLIQHNAGIPYLVGIVSGGKGCARPNKYGVYANVIALNSWIKKTMQDLTFKSNEGEIWLNDTNATVVIQKEPGIYDYVKMYLQKNTDEFVIYKNLTTKEYFKIRKDMKSAKVKIDGREALWTRIHN